MARPEKIYEKVVEIDERLQILSTKEDLSFLLDSDNL
jgi:hypothetical protein